LNEFDGDADRVPSRREKPQLSKQKNKFFTRSCSAIDSEHLDENPIKNLNSQIVPSEIPRSWPIPTRGVRGGSSPMPADLDVTQAR
jgi:hypothetical protein